jgi:hypothetical protein
MLGRDGAAAAIAAKAKEAIWSVARIDFMGRVPLGDK